MAKGKLLRDTLNIADVIKKESAGWTLLNNKLMRLFFDDNKEAAQLMLNVILGRTDLIVKSSRTEQYIEGMRWRSVALDILAVDEKDNKYDIEIQRDIKKATPKRARHYSAMMDSHMLLPDQDTRDMRDSYVIFITETDKFKHNKPLYRIERMNLDTNRRFNDGSHIIYVNGACQDSDTELGRLMHDLRGADPDQMHYDILASKMRYYKNTEEGDKKMRDLIDEIIDEIREETREEARAEALAEGAEQKQIEVAIKMIARGDSINDVADITGLSVEKVTELAGAKAS